MENAVEALKIAFAVMVFTIALTLAISTFSQARETSEAVLYMNDKTNYYEYEEVQYNEETDQYTVESEGITYSSKRIVGIEAIIPTLYRYYKENYTVIFVKEDGSELPIYYLDSNRKWSSTTTTTPINYFDLNSEIVANCPWVGTINKIKKNLDLFLKGTSIPGMTLEDRSFGNKERFVTYNGFINEYKDNKFLEQLGEYSTDRNYGIKEDDFGQKWLVIGEDEWKYNSDTGKVQFLDVNGRVIGEKKISDFLEEKELDINNNATTYWDPESGEIIELAKPTIKRVIKYTLQTP